MKITADSQTSSVTRRTRRVVAGSIFLAVAIFCIDMTIQLGVAIGVAYLGVVLAVASLNRKRLVWTAAGSASLLIVIGYVTSPTGGVPYQVLSNRALSLAIVWLLAFTSVQRIRARLAQERGEERTRQIVDSALDAIIGMDESGRITHWNPRAVLTFGWAVDDVLGRVLGDTIVPERLRARDADGMHNLSFNGKGPLLNRRFKLTVSRRSGEEFPIELTIIPIESGEVLQFAAFIRDLTDRDAAEEEIRRTNSELASRTEEMEAFVYTVSHDLKSPLVTMQGFVGIMSEDLEEGRYKELPESLQRVQRAADHMGRLLDDLLQFSRVGTVRTEFVEIETVSLVREVADKLSSRISDRGAELIINGDIPNVTADRLRLEQVFENLLSNAIKYGTAARKPVIEIGGQSLDGEVRLYVRDNGHGIREQHHKRIFSLFHRLESSDQEQGTGLGLTVVKRIAQLHGGTAWVQSCPGHGSTFWVSLSANPSPKQRRFRLESDTSTG